MDGREADLGLIPVSRFATCIHMDAGVWCAQPVQFLMVDMAGHPVTGVCGDHGHEIAEAVAGAPVVWGEPLGFISREDPAGAE